MLVHLPREEGYRHKETPRNGPALAGYGATTMKNALANTMSTLPTRLARSVTWDRGKEMSAHAQFKVETGIPVFFADPQAPWQRGTNENTNGLLRQYFPKGIDISRWSAEDIEAVAHALNTRNALMETINGLYKAECIRTLHPRLPRRPYKIRHRRLGLVVQQPKAPLDAGKRPARRVRASPLRCS